MIGSIRVRRAQTLAGGGRRRGEREEKSARLSNGSFFRCGEDNEGNIINGVRMVQHVQIDGGLAWETEL